MEDQKLTPRIEEVQSRFDVQFDAQEKPLHVQLRHWIVFARRVWWLVVLLLSVVVVWRVWLSGSMVGVGGPPLLLLIAVAVGLLVIIGFFYVDWRNDAFIMTNQRLIHVEKVILLFESRNEIPLSNVQNIRASTRGLLGRLLSYGDIEVETAARRLDLIFGPIHRPMDLQSQVMSRVRALQAQFSAQMMRDTLLHRLHPDLYDPPEVAVPATAETAYKPRQQAYVLFPANPRVQGDRITWYKHYFFLLRRLFWPSLLLLALLVGGLFLLRQIDADTLLWLLWGGGLVLLLGVVVVQYQLWLGDIYVLTENTILDITRTPFALFGETRRVTSLGRVQNITFEKPGLLANLLNYGDVLIQTAGEQDFTFDLVPRPEEVQREIQSRMEFHRAKEEQRRREEIAQWLVAYRDLTGSPEGE